MRALLPLLLCAAAAGADLVADIKRSFRPDEPGERVALLRSARALVGPADDKLRNRAAAALEKALRKEASPAVRVAVLDFLLELRTGRALDRLVAAAVDPHETVRTHVHFLVKTRADPRLFHAVRRALAEDASWRLRAAMVDLLLSGGRERARRPLLEALGDAHPGVAARAAEALERLTGQPFGLDPDRWRAWFAEQAKARRAPDGTDETVTVAGGLRKVELYEGPIRGLTPDLYTVPILRKRVIFVVDMSGSMSKGSRSEQLHRLKAAIHGLASDVRFNVVAFDQRLFFFAEAKSLEPATIANKVAVGRWIDELPAGERTDVIRSVVTGLAMLREALKEDAESRAELFLLTDGRETVKTTSLNALENQYRKLPKDRCRIHVIALGKRGTSTLRRLAETTGGQYVEHK